MEQPNDINELSDISADKIVEKYIAIYGYNVIESVIPCCIDGLKKSHRRILWTLGTTEDKVRVIKLASKVMDIHHHGDGSISDTITLLAQSFSNIVPLIHPTGSVGNFGGESAAAVRYLDVTSAEFTRDVYFNDTNIRILNIILTPDGMPEPKYFVPKIPMALLVTGLGIAIGFKSQVIPFGFKELCNLTEEFVKLRKSTIRYRSKYNTLVKYLIPDYPTYGLIRNYKQLKEKYENNEIKNNVVADGILNITPTSITIKSIPFISDMSKDEAAIENSRKQKGNWYDKYIQELIGSSDEVDYADTQFNLKRGVDPFSILDEFKKHVTFTRSMTPVYNWLDDQYKLRRDLTMFDILEMWYDERFKYIRTELKHSQTKLIIEHRKLEALIIVADPNVATQVNKIFVESNTVEDTIKPLTQRYKLTEFQVKFLASLTNSQMTKTGRDELMERKLAVEKKIKNLQHEFANISDRILNEVTSIKNKYSDKIPRKLKLPEFIGYVKIGPVGIMQYNSMEELIEIISTFNSMDTVIHPYYKTSKYKYLLKDNLIQDESQLSLPKEMSGNQIFSSSNKPKALMTINTDSIVNGYQLPYIKPLPDNITHYSLVGSKCLIITKCGHVKLIDTKEYLDHRYIKGVGVKSDIVHFSNTTSEDIVVIHGNINEPNCLRVNRIQLTNKSYSKLSTLAIGETEILAVLEINNMLLLTIPNHLTKRCKIKHLYISNLLNFIGDNNRIKIMLHKNKTSNSKKIVRYKSHPDIYQIK